MAPERVIIWGSGSAPAWRALVALEEKGLEYTSKLIEFSKGGHKTPEVFALNPRGQVPTFKDGDVVVNESLAILLYLEDAYPEPSLLPKETKARAVVYQRLQESSNLQAKVSGIIRLKLFTKDPDEALVQEKIKELEAELKFWEDYVKAGYVAGSTFTLADAAVGPFALVLKRFGATLKNHPNLAKYIETLEARPSFQKTYPPHWRDTPNQTFLTSI